MQQQKPSLLRKAQFAFLLCQETRASFYAISVIFLISEGVIREIEKQSFVFSVRNMCVSVWIFKDVNFLDQ